MASFFRIIWASQYQNVKSFCNLMQQEMMVVAVVTTRTI